MEEIDYAEIARCKKLYEDEQIEIKKQEEIEKSKPSQPLFEFVDVPNEFVELTQEVENRINSMMGASGAICMDGKTKIIGLEKKIDYGPVMDLAGNIIETPVVDEELLRRVEGRLEENKKFVKNSVFH